VFSVANFSLHQIRAPGEIICAGTHQKVVKKHSFLLKKPAFLFVFIHFYSFLPLFFQSAALLIEFLLTYFAYSYKYFAHFTAGA